MEETLQQEKQESEYKNSNEDQGGIRRRLRDRDLLRKRKAEAEAKETNEVESQRKRPRAESGTKRRGRPKKVEAEISVVEEEAAGPQEAPAVAAVAVAAEVIPDPTPCSALDVESKPSSALAPYAPLPVFGSIQKPLFAPTLSPPAPANPTADLFSPSAPAPSTAKVLDTAPIPVQDSALAPEAILFPFPFPDPIPIPVPVPIQAPFPVSAPAPPAAPPQVETLFTESQGKEAHDQVRIEDLGPEEGADISPSPDEGADEDLIETTSLDVPEQNEMFSIPTWSSTPPPQKYFPGNSF